MPLHAIGIDLGKKRIGLAISDERGQIAFPWQVLRAQARLEQSIDSLMQITAERTPTLFVVGLPLTLQNAESSFTLIARTFIDLLTKRAFPIPVVEWDERLTSAGAERHLRKMGAKRKERAARSDTLAACALLQSYLDYHNRSP